jgi:glycosyltransferase involved in cell wall biosynthesis
MVSVSPDVDREGRADYPPTVRERIHVVERYDNRDLPGLLAGHQSLVSMSLAEGFPGTVLERMACGLAPVATRLSGTRTIISDGDNGRLIPPADEAGLVETIESLLVDRTELARIRKAAWHRAQEFSCDGRQSRRRSWRNTRRLCRFDAVRSEQT